MRFPDHFSALPTDERVFSFACTQRQMDCLVACDDLGSADPTFYNDHHSLFPVTEGNIGDHSIWEFASFVKFKMSKDGNRGAAEMATMDAGVGPCSGQRRSTAPGACRSRRLCGSQARSWAPFTVTGARTWR